MAADNKNRSTGHSLDLLRTKVNWRLLIPPNGAQQHQPPLPTVLRDDVLVVRIYTTLYTIRVSLVHKTTPYNFCTIFRARHDNTSWRRRRKATLLGLIKRLFQSSPKRQLSCHALYLDKRQTLHNATTTTTTGQSPSPTGLQSACRTTPTDHNLSK